ncbi:zinc-binding dehydrogenase [Microbacterium sp. MAHUQ-60]|uniref:zinc-binding dehydrogenase n=1 Tax=unclassified Microbacterium TaxID=2609290 RepID=UPI00362051ED
MRAVYIDKKETFAVREVEIPEPDAGQVRVRIDYVGVCGSDLHYYYEGANGAFQVREPLIPGHEVSGRIDFDPRGEWAPGTAVTVHPATFGTPRDDIADDPHLWPGGAYLGSASTWPHTQGGLVEQLLVAREMVRLLPAGLPVRRAVLAEPLAVALHGLGKAGDVTGRRVLVTGSGPIGLLAVAAAVGSGAEVHATDVFAGPLRRARALGATETFDVTSQEVPGDAYDVVLECSGVAASVSTALRAVRIGGTVVQVGMVPDAPRPINIAPFIAKEVRWSGSFRFKDEIDEAVRRLAANPAIEDVITHEFAADDAVAAFATARDSDASGKVIVAVWPADA